MPRSVASALFPLKAGGAAIHMSWRWPAWIQWLPKCPVGAQRVSLRAISDFSLGSHGGYSCSMKLHPYWYAQRCSDAGWEDRPPRSMAVATWPSPSFVPCASARFQLFAQCPETIRRRAEFRCILWSPKPSIGPLGSPSPRTARRMRSVPLPDLFASVVMSSWARPPPLRGRARNGVGRDIALAFQISHCSRAHRAGLHSRPEP
jgi:hypothetical protein